MEKVYIFIGKITLAAIITSLFVLVAINGLQKEMDIQDQKIQAEKNYWNEYNANK